MIDKKVFDLAIVEKTLLNTGIDAQLLNNCLITFEQYNKGLIKLHTPFADNITLQDIVNDLGIEYNTKRIAGKLVVVYDNFGINDNRYEIYFPQSGSIYSMDKSMEELKYLGNVCEFVYSIGLKHKYTRTDGSYVHTWIKRSYTTYIKQIRRHGYRPINFVRLPRKIKQKIADFLN